MKTNGLNKVLIVAFAMVSSLVFATGTQAAWVEEAKLTASDGAAGQWMGGFVAIEDTVALVGGYSDKVYVYNRSGSVWSEVQILTASVSGGYFGAKGMEVEGNTALIPAFQQSNNDGAVYAFTFDGANWTESQRIAGPTNSRFGSSLDMQGTRAVIGAERTGTNSQGAAYIYDFDGASWSQTAQLLPAVSSRYFGCASGLDGNTAVIGAKSDSSDKGAAYIFEDDGSGWTEVVKLLASDGVGDAEFGKDVSIDGDTVVVGAPSHDGHGAVYVFQRDVGGENNWGQVAKLVSNDISDGDWFGRAVLLDGDMLLVGAQQYETANPGAVYVFNGSGANWTQSYKLTASDGEAADSFGVGLDWDGTRIITGAAFDDDKGSDAGAAYIFQSVPSIPGDANGDLLVDEDDAAILADNWLASGAGWAMGDFNNDQKVDDKDATLMATNWTGSVAASAPEPSSLVLLCIAAAAMFALRRRID